MGATRIMTPFWLDKRLAEIRRKTGAIPDVHHATCLGSVPSVGTASANMKTNMTLDVEVPFKSPRTMLDQTMHPKGSLGLPPFSIAGGSDSRSKSVNAKKS